MSLSEESQFWFRTEDEKSFKMLPDYCQSFQQQNHLFINQEDDNEEPNSINSMEIQTKDLVPEVSIIKKLGPRIAKKCKCCHKRVKKHICPHDKCQGIPCRRRLSQITQKIRRQQKRQQRVPPV